MAQKYRKRPVVIEAMQWDGTRDEAFRIIAWVRNLGGECRYQGPDAYIMRAERPELIVETLEDGFQGQTTHTASPGDWIIRGIRGEFYPCKPDVFAATYDAVIE